MVDVTVVKSESGELIKMGPIEIRVLEDGRNTDNRIGSVVLKIGPKTKGVGLPPLLSPLPMLTYHPTGFIQRMVPVDLLFKRVSASDETQPLLLKSGANAD